MTTRRPFQAALATKLRSTKGGRTGGPEHGTSNSESPTTVVRALACNHDGDAAGEGDTRYTDVKRETTDDD